MRGVKRGRGFGRWRMWGRRNELFVGLYFIDSGVV